MKQFSLIQSSTIYPWKDNCMQTLTSQVLGEEREQKHSWNI